MVDANSFRNMALQLPNTEEQPHFHRQAFRINGKTIFATLDEKLRQANLRLTEIDQSVFCKLDSQNIHAVPNAWGRKGWTTFNLHALPKAVVKDALRAAYEAVASKK